MRQTGELCLVKTPQTLPKFRAARTLQLPFHPTAPDTLPYSDRLGNGSHPILDGKFSLGTSGYLLFRVFCINRFIYFYLYLYLNLQASDYSADAQINPCICL